MREYTVNELFYRTRAELLSLDHEMVMALASLPEHAEERTIVLINLHRIRRELGRRDVMPN